MAKDGILLASSMIPLFLATFLCTTIAGLTMDKDNLEFFNSTLEKYCPETTIFSQSVSEDTFTGNQYPCCKSCSVHKECGRYRNCCYYGDDVYRYAESGSEACILSSFGSSTPSTDFYYMVSNCLDPNQDCQHARAASWGPFYPVYSHNSKRIYVNEHCALCNGQKEVTSFQPIFGCLGMSRISHGSYTDELAKLLAGKNATECQLIFKPPEGTDLTNYKCTYPVIRTCLLGYGTSGLPSEVETLTLCESFNATTLIQNDFYKSSFGNVFCALCNGETNLSVMCSVQPERDARTSFGLSFHSILSGMKQFSADAPTPYGVSMGKQICRTNKTFYSGTMCKPLLCPEGRLWDGDTCRIFIDYRGVRSYFITVKLTNANPDQQLPASLLESLEQEERGPRALWLKRAWLQDWDAHVFYKTLNESVDTVEYIIVMLKFDYQGESNMAFVNILDIISVSMATNWAVRIFDQRFYFQVKFDKHTRYNIVSEAKLEYTGFNIHALSITEIDYVKRLSNYNHIFLGMNRHGLFITETFFCNQIDLLPFEYKDYIVIIYFHEKNIFLGDSQFKFIHIDNNAISLRMCQQTWADNTYAVSATSQLLRFQALSIISVAAPYLTFSLSMTP